MHCHQWNLPLTAALLLLCSQTAIAADQPSTANALPQTLSEKIRSSLVVELSAGPGWESAGQTQSIYLQPAIVKTYTANHSTNTFLNGELFVGVQHDLNAKIQGQVGVSATATSNADVKGNIWDDADPAFNNYTYRYKVQHLSIAVKGKLLTNLPFYALTSYISGSAGVGFNQAHDFSNTPTLSEAIASPNFSSNTNTAFTYTIGIGVQKALTAQWQGGIGYEFSDWGSSQLGRAPGQTMNSGLSMNHLYTNALLFNLMWTA